MNYPHIAGRQGMRYWVVREVAHWFIPCVQLFFGNFFCLFFSFFCVVWYFLNNSSSFMKHLFKNRALHSAIALLLSLYGRSCRQGKATWKYPSTCCRIPFIILGVVLSSTDGQTLVSASVFSKSVSIAYLTAGVILHANFASSYAVQVNKSVYLWILLKDLGL